MPGAASRATRACATARQMSMRSAGDTSAASLRASAGSTNRWPRGVRSMCPAASASDTARAASARSRSVAAPRSSISTISPSTASGAQDGEHGRGEVLGHRFRWSSTTVSKGSPGPAPARRVTTTATGRRRAARARWRSRSAVCGSTRWTSSTAMTTPPDAAARTSSRAATKTRFGCRRRPPAEQRLQLGPAAVGDGGQHARPPAHHLVEGLGHAGEHPQLAHAAPPAGRDAGVVRGVEEVLDEVAARLPGPGDRHGPAGACRQSTHDPGDERVRRRRNRRRSGCRRRPGDPVPADLEHLSDEAEASPVDRADQALITPVVADRPPGGLDAARKGRLGDEPVAPDLVEQLGLRDDPVAVPDEVVEHVHDLRLDRDPLPATLELHRVAVERHVSESHPHQCQLRGSAWRRGRSRCCRRRSPRATPRRLQARSSLGGG